MSMAVKAREGGDEETADQLVSWASELFKHAAYQEAAQHTRQTNMRCPTSPKVVAATAKAAASFIDAAT